MFDTSKFYGTNPLFTEPLVLVDQIEERKETFISVLEDVGKDGVLTDEEKVSLEAAATELILYEEIELTLLNDLVDSIFDVNSINADEADSIANAMFKNDGDPRLLGDFFEVQDKRSKLDLRAKVPLLFPDKEIK